MNSEFSTFTFSFRLRGFSSVGRALPLQGRCQRFESANLHIDEVSKRPRFLLEPRAFLIEWRFPGVRPRSGRFA